jgi:hypothetical protein
LKELEMMKIVTKAFVIRVEEKNEFANWLWEMTMEIGVRPYKLSILPCPSPFLLLFINGLDQINLRMLGSD